MELVPNCVKTIPLEWKHFSVVMPQKLGLQRRGAEPKLIITHVKLSVYKTWSYISGQPAHGPKRWNQPPRAPRQPRDLRKSQTCPSAPVKATDYSSLRRGFNYTHYHRFIRVNTFSPQDTMHHEFQGRYKNKKANVISLKLFPNTQKWINTSTAISGYLILTSKYYSSQDGIIRCLQRTNGDTKRVKTGFSTLDLFFRYLIAIKQKQTNKRIIFSSGSHLLSVTQAQ